jgi:predicted permease
VNERGPSDGRASILPWPGALLLRIFVPADVRDSVLGDLEEVYRRQRVERGRLYAGAWFGVQAVWFSGRFLPERLRDAGGAILGSAAPSALDFRLGVRMLVKTPLLTVTGCLAIATAIGINAGFHEFMHDMFSPTVDIPGVERVVGFVNRDLETGFRESRLLEDVGRWREELETVGSIGAALALDLNVVGAEGAATPVRAVEIHAAAFRVGGAVPIHGRPLLDSDDGPGAPPVAVLGHDVWRSRLGGDEGIIGTTIRVGGTPYTVVGILPRDFTFPVYSEVWLNFRRDLQALEPRSGPGVLVFGGLEPGSSVADARAEISRLGIRVSETIPDTHEHLRPDVLPFQEYVVSQTGMPPWALAVARSFFVLLLLVASANVATLVFARTARRESEIAVRGALGAGRARIVGQLFAEATVLALLSAGIGLAATDWAMRYGSDVFWEVQRMDAPSWWDPGLSGSTVAYSLLLAVVGAALIGVLPALRATRGGGRATLHLSGSGGGTLRFGLVPTAVIVVQVALSVAFIPIVLTGAISNLREQLTPASFDTEQYLSARLRLDGRSRIEPEDEPRRRARLIELRDQLNTRLLQERAVRRATFADRLPGLMGQSVPGAYLEIEGLTDLEDDGHVMTGHVDWAWFGVMGREVLEGRAFTPADYSSETRVALVNELFVEKYLAGRSPVGQRVRRWQRDGDPGRPWTEIVGLVPDEVVGPAKDRAHVYFPLAEAEASPLRLALEVEGDPAAFSSRLRTIAAEVDPAIMVDEVLPLARVRRGEVVSEMYFVALLILVGFATLLLTTTGTYALMSFLVSQRTREIGIRTALGAHPAIVARDVFRRAIIQLCAGAVLGALVSTSIYARFMGLQGETAQEMWVTLTTVSAFVVLVGLVGTAIPVRRGLRIQPTEALRAEG